MKKQGMQCPAEFTLAVIGGRWKVLILYHGEGSSSIFARSPYILQASCNS